MRYSKFRELDQWQQISLVTAIHIGNQTADTVTLQLSNEQANELNGIICQSIYDVVKLAESARDSDEGRRDAAIVRGLVKLIPEHQKVPQGDSLLVHLKRTPD